MLVSATAFFDTATRRHTDTQHVRPLYCSIRDVDFDTKPRQPGQAVLIGSIPRLVSTSLSSLSQVCRQR